MHTTFTEPAGTCFGGTGYPITRANIKILFPYGVPGSYEPRDVLDRLRGWRAEPEDRHVARVVRLLGRSEGRPPAEPAPAAKKSPAKRKRKRNPNPND